MVNSNDNTEGNNPSTTTIGKVVYCENEQQYYQSIESAGTRLVVVDCFAEWCPPCKEIAPVYDALAQQHPEVLFLKVDVDETPSIKVILGVWAMPTFFFLREGNKLGSVMGANESALRRGIANDGNIGGICSSCSVQ